MSNNPVLPPPNMDDSEAIMIREQNPLLEEPADISGISMETVTQSRLGGVRREPYPPKPKPRRAKQTRNPILTYIALGAWFAVAGFIGAFLGMVCFTIL